MAKFNAPGAGSYASAPAAGLAVFNDLEWVVEPKANGDLIYIGDVDANHELLPEACSVYFLGTGLAADQVAAMTLDVFVGDAKTAANTIVNDAAAVADTPARVAFSTHLLCKQLGASAVPRPVYLDLGVAPTTKEGKVVVRLAQFAK